MYQKNEILLNNLNKEQKLAVVFNDGPLRIIAGAGSGKTRVLIHKIAYLIKRMDVLPYKILAVTFTNKAAKEMKERISKMLDSSENEAKISTFHALCAYILRQDIDKIGYEKNFNILDTTDQFDILRNIYQKLNINKYDIPLRSALNYISYSKMNEAQINILEKELDEIKNQKFKILSLYKNILKELNSLDFNDLLLKTLELFKVNLEVRNKWSNRFKYILIDEFQDTSPLQYKIIKILAKSKNLIIVGDPDQTIYSWRGANVNLILNFEKDFPKVKTISLIINYRSTKKIIFRANELIKNNKKRLSYKLSAYNAEGEDVIFNHAYNTEAEAKWVAFQIKDLVNTKNIELKNIAVFYRANYYSKNIEDALLRNNIFHQVYGGEKFYERKEIKDAISYLRLFFTDSQLAFQRILNIPSRSIGNTYRNKFEEYCEKNNLTFFEAIEKKYFELPLPSTPTKNLIDLIDKIKDYRKLIIKDSKNFNNYVDDFFDEIGYYDYLKKEDISNNGKIENVKELLNIIKSWFENNQDKTFENYFEEIALATDIDNLENNSNSVTLMNIHNCKGLEFDYVFLVGLTEEVLPSKKALENDYNGDNLEEERRLAYVAITRARKKLFLSDAAGYHFDKFRTQKKTSRFVKEMGIEINNIKNIDSFVNKILVNDLNKDLKIQKIKEKFQSNNDDIFVGDKITHKIFGEGIVVDESLGQIIVDFPNTKGLKTLIKNHSAIKKL